MAHRGRLNVLVNVLGKSPSMLFSEFEGKLRAEGATRGSGDVKYHKGFSADLRTAGGNVHVVLAFNPSHLEVVDAVVEGSVRARQEQRGDATGATILPLLIHGDAAFAGQGVVMETLQLSQARGIRDRRHAARRHQQPGRVHDQRSRRRPFDALLQRRCEDDRGPDLPRERGRPGGGGVRGAPRARLPHEVPQGRGDRPGLLPPARPQRGGRAGGDPAAHVPGDPQARDCAPDLRPAARAGRPAGRGPGRRDARGLSPRPRGRPPAGAGVRRHERQQVHGGLEPPHRAPTRRRRSRPRSTRKRMDALAKHAHPGARGFHAASARRAHHRRPRAHVRGRDCRSTGAQRRRWPTRRCSTDGYDIRLTGQDTARGTFFHRHAVLHDQATGQTDTPLARVAKDKVRFRVIDSTLSEEAVLGFEYGYSTTDPSTLVIWEGQFGDFVNGAQVIIDQFITSGEAKWGRVSRHHAVPAARLRRPGPRAQLGRGSSASCSCPPS